MITVQTAPSASTAMLADGVEAILTATKLLPDTTRADFSGDRPCVLAWVGSALTSITAGLSNTTQTASDRRKTAAPTGARQGKRSTAAGPSIRAVILTCPPIGVGSARVSPIWS